MRLRVRKHEKFLSDAQSRLSRLQAESNHTLQYYSDQWKRQRQCQLDLMKNDSLSKLHAQLELLVDLEEQLREAQ